MVREQLNVMQNAGQVTIVFLEADVERYAMQLLRKQVDLVQQQDQRGVPEPHRVADAAKQREALAHTILR